MAGTFWTWLIPGVISVVGGTALAVTQTESAVVGDLEARTSAVLKAPDLSWANVVVDGRDATVTGTATTQKMIDDLVARVAATHGIRSVISKVDLAELLQPFPFWASVKAGTTQLAGGYPSEAVHAALLADAGRATDGTKLYSGAPEGFEAAAKFGLKALSQLDDGEIKLSNLNLTISGRAKSAAAFDELQTLTQHMPLGTTIASLKIIPPLASPYVWSAKFDGTSLTITGDVPAADLVDRLRAAAPANVPVSTTLSLASGEPSGFSDNTLTLLKNLLLLEQGEASISDGTIALRGAPGTTVVAETVRTATEAMGGTADLEPPRIAEFGLGIDKSGSALTFSGFVPDAATKAKLAALPGADVSKLALGRGAPDRFASAVDFGLAALTHLSDGQFGIKGTRLSIGGRAATVADFKAALDLVAQGAPQGLTLAASELHPPTASPFVWSAVKAEG